MPASPWLYPPDQMSDAPVRQLAAEITREKLFERLHQELPYHSTVETEQWKELRGGKIRIEQTIYVERESQRKIVIGKGGQTLKSIGETSRREISEIIEAKVDIAAQQRRHQFRCRAIGDDGKLGSCDLLEQVR